VREFTLVSMVEEIMIPINAEPSIIPIFSLAVLKPSTVLTTFY